MIFAEFAEFNESCGYRVYSMSANSYIPILSRSPPLGSDNRYLVTGSKANVFILLFQRMLMLPW